MSPKLWRKKWFIISSIIIIIILGISLFLVTLKTDYQKQNDGVLQYFSANEPGMTHASRKLEQLASQLVQ